MTLPTTAMEDNVLCGDHSAREMLYVNGWDSGWKLGWFSGVFVNTQLLCTVFWQDLLSCPSPFCFPLWALGQASSIPQIPCCAFTVNDTCTAGTLPRAQHLGYLYAP